MAISRALSSQNNIFSEVTPKLCASSSNLSFSGVNEFVVAHARKYPRTLSVGLSRKHTQYVVNLSPRLGRAVFCWACNHKDLLLKS